MKAIILFICGLLLTSVTFSQSTVRGQVLDIQTNQPLEGATVTNGKASTLSQSNGEFVLQNISPEDSITISYLGYASQTLSNPSQNRFLKIQLTPSTIALNEVIVSGYESNRKLLETSGSIALITHSDLNRNNNVSLLPVLNKIPGVQVDQSHSEDARISIRGVGIQSNFGIRNLKVYLNDIPLTEANGFTRIEGIDISTLGRAEIIKGPASSIYGAALGGVLLFQTERAPYNQTSIEQSALVGTYGLFRTNTTFRSGTDNANITATYGYQKLDGYRNWSSDERNFISATGQFTPNENQTISIFLNHSQQNAHIPGAIDSVEFANDSSKADSTTLSKKAARYEKWTRAGISHKYRFNDHLTNVTSLHLGFFTLDHPLAFAYIRGTYQSFGGRTHFLYSNKFGNIETRFILGAEYLNGLYVNKYYENNLGKEGVITQDAQTTAVQYSFFGQAEIEFPRKIILTIGGSNSAQLYRLKDFLKPDGNDFSGNKNFHPSITPRIALLKKWQNNIALYATVSSAFMPPVDYEITLPGGGINKNLHAVKGVNYEVGSRGELFNKKIRYDISLYDLKLNNELIPQTIAPYQTIYVNAGKTNHKGLEASLDFIAVKNDHGFLSLLQPYITYTFSDYTFTDYVLDEKTFNGNKLTGISPNILNVGVYAHFKSGIYMNGSWYYRDQFPITDDNIHYNKSYSVVDAKIGFKKLLGKFQIDIYAGINNALDEKYASYIDLNAASYYPGMLPKFYNPSSRRNYYGGASLKFIIK